MTSSFPATDRELVAFVLGNTASTGMELDLALALSALLDEIDRLTAEFDGLEVEVEVEVEEDDLDETHERYVDLEKDMI
jgi:hypothetical protein